MYFLLNEKETICGLSFKDFDVRNQVRKPEIALSDVKTMFIL
jgi:hypothetical protein